VRIYFDPSVLISFYVAEEASGGVREFIQERDLEILLNSLQELELKNGIRQKVLRREISESTAAKSLRLLEDDFIAGIITTKPVAWDPVYTKAERLSRKLSNKQSCRSFDLLHIAIAAVSGVRHFATLDKPQAALARAAGLDLIEFRQHL
jgi:predicted nucleic acid-binding protein